MADDLIHRPAAGLAALLDARKISSVELVQALLQAVLIGQEAGQAVAQHALGVVEVEGGAHGRWGWGRAGAQRDKMSAAMRLRWISLVPA